MKILRKESYLTEGAKVQIVCEVGKVSSFQIVLNLPPRPGVVNHQLRSAGTWARLPRTTSR